jgi:Tol biopolymer transport system component
MAHSFLRILRPRSLCAIAAVGAALMPLAATGAPGETTLVSTSFDGASAQGWVTGVSPDGRFVVFQTSSHDVVPGGNTTGLVRVDRLHDTRVMVAQTGSSQATISADGRYVAIATSAPLLATDTNRIGDVYVRDVDTGVLVCASVGLNGADSNGWSDNAVISANGRYVTFYSDASNLVPNDTNGAEDIFVRDLLELVTERVNIDSAGRQVLGLSWSPTISDDGRFVVFHSTASTLVAGDTNQASDVFIRDRQLDRTERVSVATGGGQANDLSYSAWSPGTVSPDGRYVAFLSGASNLVPGDTNGIWDIFIRDRERGTTERMSVSSSGAQATSMSFGGVVSRDGRYVSFMSAAPELVPGDLNGLQDVFVRDRVAGTTVRATVSSRGVQSNGDTWEPSLMTADGSRVFFNNTGTNLVDLASPPGQSKVFMHELGAPSSDVPIVVEPKLYDFGLATIFVTEPGRLVLTNTSDVPISIASLKLGGTNPALFRAKHACGGSVAAHDACQVDITFRPTTLGPKSAVLTVITNVAAQDVELRGTGVLAQFSLSNTSVDFGSQAVGTMSATHYVKVRNTGTTLLPIRWIVLAGGDKDQFGRVRRCRAILEPGRACNIPVWFKPTTAGVKSARLVVSPGESGKAKSVALSGEGT